MNRKHFYLKSYSAYDNAESESTATLISNDDLVDQGIVSNKRYRMVRLS